MTHINTNVGAIERALSILAGTYLLYNTLIRQRANGLQTMAGSYLLLRGVTGLCLAYRTLGKTEVDYRAPNINIKTSLTVNRPKDQVYGFWRRLENLPRFMKHLSRVEVLDERTSEWTAKIAGDIGTLSWKSEIVKDDPGALLSWHSLPGSSVENAGKITFENWGDSGTELTVVISYHAPLGILGEKAGRLINPLFEKMVKNDVVSFKRYIESSADMPGVLERQQRSGFQADIE